MTYKEGQKMHSREKTSNKGQEIPTTIKYLVKGTIWWVLAFCFSCFVVAYIYFTHIYIYKQQSAVNES